MRLMTMICLLSLITAGLASAYAPPAMTFQGRVTEAGGGAVSDGNHSLTFRIYNQLNGGAPLWNSTRNVNVQDGIFSVVLGQNNPLNLDFDEPYFIGVQYEAEAEMAPRVPFTSAPFALGVSEDHAVTALNGRTGDIQLLAGANVSITPVGAGFVIAATGAVADNDWTVDGSNMYSNPTGSVGIGEMSPASKLHVKGDVRAGSVGYTGRFVATQETGANTVLGGDYSNQGAELLLKSEDSFNTMGVQPDFDGEGGFFWVARGGYANGFVIDGNYFNQGSPLISMLGSGSSAYFDMNESEDAAVSLPVNAINAVEILNETGLTTEQAHGSNYFPVETSYSSVMQRTITAPTDGYLMVHASFEIDLRHENATASFVTAGLSQSPSSLPSNQDHSFYLPGAAANGIYLTPSSAHAVFTVAAGDHTVYLNASRAGTDDARIWDAQLTVVFIPTAYGTVAAATVADDGRQGSNDTPSATMSMGDRSAEQRDSSMANTQRLEEEMAAMRAEIEALKQQMGNNGNPEMSSR